MSDYSSLMGQTLSERYRLESQIGEGGQAVVWTGTDTENGQVRAIKLLPASFNTPQRMIDNFRDEGLLLVNLDDHENIVKVFDVGYDANLRAFYMVIGYVDGVTLADLIDARREHRPARSDKGARPSGNDKEDNGKTELRTDQDAGERTELHTTDQQSSDKTEYHPSDGGGDQTETHQSYDDDKTGVHDLQRVMTPAMSVGIVRRVAVALAHAHHSGLIHRDVKPNNILLGRNGDVKLTDFGIARLAGESGQTGLVIGTLQYMSPEQVRGQRLDLRTDVYSLGVVLYECLTGRAPFSFAERQFVPTHIINTPPQPLVELNPEVPIELQNVVLKALAKEPAARYQTMTEFEDALVGMVNSGLLPAIDREKIAAAVAPLSGSIDVVQVESPAKLDSNQRCPTCGAPLPAGWQTALTECPGCAGPLDNVVTRESEKVAEFIRQARQKRDIGTGKVGVDMAMFLFTRELQGPSFEEWKKQTTGSEPEIQKGTVVMPAPAQERPKEADLLATARQLMAIADFLTDPQLQEYNQRWPERYETDALAAHARAKAYQLLGRYHTLRGSFLVEPESAAAAYDNARHDFILAGEQYQRAIEGWRSYEKQPAYERIHQYYEPVRDEVNQRRLWAEVADLLVQGILRFPHDDSRQESYASFRDAAKLGKQLQSSPGIAIDLKVAELYDNYDEKAKATRNNHLAAIDEAQTTARQVIAEAQATDTALQAEDRRLAAGWLRDRACIALDYHHKQEDLPVLLRRIRLLAEIAGYVLALVLVVAFIGEARHVYYTLDNPGPFWPGWPMILSQSPLRSYSIDFGNWHFFLVMLAGIDWFIFWPFNLIAARQVPRARRTGRLRPVIPALSQLAFPIIDWLDNIARRPTSKSQVSENGTTGKPAERTGEKRAEGTEPGQPTNDVPGEGRNDDAVESSKDAADPTPIRTAPGWANKMARFLLFIAPWVPILWLTWHLWLAFSNPPRPFPGNYSLWLLTLFLGPPFAGYFAGRHMLRISEKLDRLESDERDEHEQLDLKTRIERDRVRRERGQQAAVAVSEFGRASSEYDTNRAAVIGILQVWLARMLHYKKESDFVDLPSLERTLKQWRKEVDSTFLRLMGLGYTEAEVRPVSEAAWRAERPLNTLPITSRLRPIPLRIFHDRDGYVLWGVDGFKTPQRARLRNGTGGYSLAVELLPTAEQVNFMFETADHRWPGEIHTIWIEAS